MSTVNTINPDPTVAITGAGDAVLVAESLIPAVDESVRAEAVTALGALLFAASPVCRGAGIGWVIQAAGVLEDATDLEGVRPGWEQAWRRCHSFPVLRAGLISVRRSEDRDRVIAVVREAVRTWPGTRDDDAAVGSPDSCGGAGVSRRGVTRR